jgi:hypothetical protein
MAQNAIWHIFFEKFLSQTLQLGFFKIVFSTRFGPWGVKITTLNFFALDHPLHPKMTNFRVFFDIRRPIAENWRHLAAIFLHHIVVLVGLVVDAKYELHSYHRSGENAVETCDFVHFRLIFASFIFSNFWSCSACPLLRPCEKFCAQELLWVGLCPLQNL